jgi:hypothetical protein
MARSSIIIILALCNIFNGINAVPVNGSNIIPSSSSAFGVATQDSFQQLPMCFDVVFPSSTGKFYTTLCLEPETNLINATEQHGLLERRGLRNTTMSPPPNLLSQTEPVNREWRGATTTRVCFRDGPQLNQKDIDKLCD